MASAILNLPVGAFVTMITPFEASTNSIDWKNVDKLVEFYLSNGICGIFTVCLSSEMYQLSEEERLQLATRIVNKVHGRVPVVAVGNMGETIDEQAESIKKMYKTGVQCVVINVSTICKQEEGISTKIGCFLIIINEKKR